MSYIKNYSAFTTKEGAVTNISIDFFKIVNQIVKRVHNGPCKLRQDRLGKRTCDEKVEGQENIVIEVKEKEEWHAAV